MKFYISYFYKIRFFPKNLIPISTAICDPKWYHNNNDNNYVFRDKRGVINGIRCLHLSPYLIESNSCSNCDKSKSPNCEFIDEYYNYLKSLDFNFVLEAITKGVKALAPDGNACLMVYETPDNMCSERWALMKWFNENGVELEEWDPC